jgi:hypothetical protein
MDSEAPDYVQGMTAHSFALAINQFTKDFDVPLDLVVGVNKSELESNIINFYTQSRMLVSKTSLSMYNRMLDLTFKVVLAELLLEKIDKMFKNIQNFEHADLVLLSSYPKLKAKCYKYLTELKSAYKSLPGAKR